MNIWGYPPYIHSLLRKVTFMNIIDLIDQIDEISMDAEAAIMESMINEYGKYLMIMENYSGNDEIFQEAKNESIMDSVKAKEKKDSNKFVSILKLIPRILIQIFKRIGNMIKDSKLGKKIKENISSLNKGDAPTIKAKVAALNKKAKGEFEFYYDEKSGKIKLKSGFDIFETIFWFGGAYKTITKIVDTINDERDFMKEHKISEMIRETKEIITDKDKREDYKNLAVGSDFINRLTDTLGDVIDDIGDATGIVTTLTLTSKKLAQYSANKELLKDVPSEKKLSMMKDIETLSSNLSKIGMMISGVTTVISTIFGTFNDISGEYIKYADKKDAEESRWVRMVYTTFHSISNLDSMNDNQKTLFGYTKLSDNGKQIVKSLFNGRNQVPSVAQAVENNPINFDDEESNAEYIKKINDIIDTDVEKFYDVDLGSGKDKRKMEWYFDQIVNELKEKGIWKKAIKASILIEKQVWADIINNINQQRIEYNNNNEGDEDGE